MSYICKTLFILIWVTLNHVKFIVSTNLYNLQNCKHFAIEWAQNQPKPLSLTAIRLNFIHIKKFLPQLKQKDGVQILSQKYADKMGDPSNAGKYNQMFKYIKDEVPKIEEVQLWELPQKVSNFEDAKYKQEEIDAELDGTKKQEMVGVNKRISIYHVAFLDLQLAVDNIASFSQHVTGSKTRTSKKLINMAEAQLKTPKTRQWAQQWNPTITDMVSLKLYTDSNTASGKFRSSFREGVISTNKQLQIDTIVWQQAMAHAFGMYTKNIDKSKVNVPPILYHGTTIACIDTFEQLLKPQSVFFAGPLSTTTIRQIAYNFALPEQGGMLLKLEFDPSSPYLPMNA
eukprot:28203_1